MDPQFRVNRLSRSANYALQGLAYLATHPTDKFHMLSVIAETQELPMAYLAKIFQKLSKRGLLKARPGVNGGYALARPADEIFLSEIVYHVDDQLVEKQCLLEMRACDSDSPCIIHDFVVKADGILIEALSKATLKDMVKNPTAIA